MKLDIKKGVKAIFTLALCAMALSSCGDSFFNGEGDCDPHYRVKFRYDYNMKYADAFAHEVNTVTLYLLDANGNIVYENTESGAALAAPTSKPATEHRRLALAWQNSPSRALSPRTIRA